MPLLFTRLCDLFSDLEHLVTRDPPLVQKHLQQRVQERITQWFGSLNLHDSNTDVDRAALLSAMFPGKRRDRVYNLKADGLSRKLKRLLRLGSGRHELLDQWKNVGRGDLGDCVLRVLREAEHPLQSASRQVTVEEIDRVLAGIAKGVRFSAPRVRDADVVKVETDVGLHMIYHRLQSREAKWFTRMILQDYSPLEIPEVFIYRCIHPQLALVMKLHDHFEDAVNALGSLSSNIDDCALKPQIGCKVGRPRYFPARGIKHAVQQIRNREMSVERKYDGEYCQIHVDLTNFSNPFQLFSKSGKDSTADRAGLHETLVDCLRVGKEDCLISSECILEGEMVVWSDREDRILDFCKIRKHVSRSGSFLGTAADSAPWPWENLMIVFYDVLLLDEYSLLSVPHAERRQLLQRLISPIRRRAELVVRRKLDFSQPRAPKQLQEYFAQAIAKRWEGLVLKPSDEPYFGPAQRAPNTYPSCWLKIKKDYIAGMGDTADFAVVGAGYDVQEAARLGNRKVNWTHFHIACLKNKRAVVHLRAKPEFVVVDAVSQSINAKDLLYLNQHGQFRALEYGSADCGKMSHFQMTPGLATRMIVAFKKPFIFEVMGGGFDKPPNSEIFRLRWPRVLKIHQDRDWKDTIDMDELQLMAANAMAVPIADELPGEAEAWRQRLEAADRGVREARLPWDDSDCEQSGDQEEKPVISEIRRASNARRLRRSTAGSLVRMDTVEMRPGEQRLANGEVTRPISQGSIFSTASGSSLPTPPTSSPCRDHPSRSMSAQLLPTPSPSGKRKCEVIILDDEDLPLKKIRTDAHPRPRSKRTPPSTSRKRKANEEVDRTSPSSKRSRPCGPFLTAPLGETANATNRIKRSAPFEQTSAGLEKISKARDFLVRKIPAMTDARFLPGSCKRPWKPMIPPSSTSGETTRSEASTQTAHSLRSPQQTSVKMANPDLKSSANDQGTSLSATHEETPFFNVEIPDLLRHRVMLSPCIYTNNNIMASYFASRLKQIIPHPAISKLLSPANVPPTPPPTNPPLIEEVILLVDLQNTDPLNKFLDSLRPYLPTCAYFIAIWDWRVLTLPLDHPKTPANLPDGTELYFGTMSFDAASHEVRVRYRNGGDGRDSQIDETHSSLRVPDLDIHPMMHSPHVSMDYHLLRNLRPGQSADLIPHPIPHPGRVANKILSPSPSSRVEQRIIIFLIDPSEMQNEQIKESLLKPLQTWLRDSGFDAIEVWHSELLKLAKEGGPWDDEVAKEKFYGTITAEHGHRNAQINVQDKAEVHDNNSTEQKLHIQVLPRESPREKRLSIPPILRPVNDSLRSPHPPDLHEHPTMFSPSLVPGSHAHIKVAYYSDQLGKLISHPDANPKGPAPMIPGPASDASRNQKTIILLIESQDNDVEQRHVEAVKRWVPESEYDGFEVWDWSVLDLMMDGVTDEESVRSRYLGAWKLE